MHGRRHLEHLLDPRLQRQGLQDEESCEVAPRLAVAVADQLVEPRAVLGVAERGELPDDAGLAAFTRLTGGLRRLDDATMGALALAAPAAARQPLGAARTALSLWATQRGLSPWLDLPRQVVADQAA